MPVPVPLEQAFAFFEDPRNLARITPGWLNFRMTSPEPVRICRGAEIDYLIRWLGLPMHWKTVIAEYEPPHFFVDEQAAGPYAMWRHRHGFQAAASGTLVSDCVDYALPLGPLGRLAHGLVVRRQLQAIFDYRQRVLGAVLAAPTARPTG